MKHLSRFFILLLVVCGAMPQCADAYIDHNVAVLRVLNKAAGKVQTVRAPVGNTVQYDKLTMLVRACKQSDPFDAENHFAFVEIFNSASEQIYGGWMNRNEPGQNPIESPDWDIWLGGCED
ncbi:MAG: DUF2155 domain-containing protein [Alphaproteobacteria bacterium]